MSKISSETLFHFTKKKECLINILKNDFRPRYVEEKFPFELEDFQNIGIPMLCFCDIRLSNVTEHVEWYGHYGIGMRREWAIENGLNPVSYYKLESNKVKELTECLKKIRASCKKTKYGYDIPIYFLNFYYSSILYMKPYEGEQCKHCNKKEKEKANKIFYDEKEWRYVPYLSDLDTIPGECRIPEVLKSEELKKCKDDNKYKVELNKRLGEKVSLKFTSDDIAYIIIEKESERLEIINEIRRIKNKYDEEAVAVLSSKILSIEQIEQDF